MSRQANEALSPDFLDLLAAFEVAEVRYMIVGGHAVGAHGRPRATKDLDLWIDGGENLERVAKALKSFGMPENFVESARTLGERDVLFFGSPPNRVDLLRTISGLTWEDAIRGVVRIDIGANAPLPVIGIQDLIANKRAAGRPRDLGDVAALESILLATAGPKVP